MNAMRTILIFTLAALALTLNAQSADVLVVEHSAALNILDAYQRTVALRVKKQWPNFTPFILGKKQTLPDQVTNVQNVLVQNRHYFLLLGAHGLPVGLNLAGYHRTFRHVKLLNDTVKIKGLKFVSILHPADRSKLERIESGQKLIRIFKYGALYYVRTWNNPLKYGWCSAAYYRSWIHLSRKDLLKESQWKDFTRQLNYFLNRKNSVYLKLFQYFRKAAGGQIQGVIPRWKMQKRSAEIYLTFTRPHYLARWPNSTKIFSKELADLCASFKFTLKQKMTGMFVITQE